MKYFFFPYRLTLNAPVILTGWSSNPNHVETRQSIPGSVLRGALALCIKRKHDRNGSAVPSLDDAIAKWIFSDSVRFLPAYPTVNDRHVVPVPLSWKRDKHASLSQQKQIIDLLAYSGKPDSANDCDEDEEAETSVWPECRLISPAGVFASMGGAELKLGSVPVEGRMHHTRDRSKQRAWKDKSGKTHGAVYSYDAVEAGTVFEGNILIRADDDHAAMNRIETIKSLLGERVFVGRSRRAGYGGDAKIEWLSQREREYSGSGMTGWGMIPINSNLSQGDEFRVLLTSPYAGRCPVTGAEAPDRFEQELMDRLGGRAEVIRAHYASEMVGGFNRHWKSEIAQCSVLKAGSVFSFRAKGNIAAGDWLEIEKDGVGERRNEGYGRFLFLKAPVSTLTHASISHSAATKPQGSPPDIISELEKRLLLQISMEKVEKLAIERARAFDPVPTNSLLGRLRLVLQRGDVETLLTWFGNDAEKALKKPAQQQLKRCKRDGESLWDHISGHCKQAGQAIIECYGLGPIVQRYSITDPDSATKVLISKSRELSIRYLRTLVSALAMKNRQKGN